MKMKLVKIIIEKTKDMFSSYAENVEGVYGGGDTVEEAKKSILDAIRLLIEHNDKKHIPAVLKGKYAIIYKYDTESFLRHYKGIFTNSALERITGINQKQFQHYATGLKKPRPAQARKIQTALHKLGSELLAVEL
jgi:predicted RNase H-like HicB family nuclease